jgi:hypothetical protein
LIFMFKIFSGILSSSILKTFQYHLILLFSNLPPSVFIFKFTECYSFCYPPPPLSFCGLIFLYISVQNPKNVNTYNKYKCCMS